MKKDKSCKKPHENLIGKVITAFLMFIPLFAIGVTCGYAIFNKNAYQSWSDNTYSVEQKLDITNLNDLIVNNLTYLQLNEDTTQYSADSYYIGYKNFNFGNNIPTEGYFTLGYNRGSSYGSFITIYDNLFNKNNAFTTDSVKGLYQFTFTGLQEVGGHTNNTYGQNLFVYSLITNTETVDNVFYYSIDKVQESPLFNWTENTAMYTVLHNFTDTLGIQATFFPMLLTYWLMIYLCYILYDFALIPLNIIHRKIHETSETL